MTTAKARVAVLVSGGGTNLQAILDGVAAGTLAHVNPVLVVSNKAQAYGITRARTAGVPTAVLAGPEYASGSNFEDALLRLVREQRIQLVVLAGFLKILSAEFISNCPCPLVNIHPALIPAFSGPGYYGLRVHRAALKAGVKVSGATVHLVNDVCDGGEILAQETVRVYPDDTPETLQARVLNEVEHVIFPRVIEELCADITASGEQLFPATKTAAAGPQVEHKTDPNPEQKTREKNTEMTPSSITEYLGGKTYPGRTLALAVDERGQTASLVYFIMGRSPNSQNRVFVKDGEVIRTEAFDAQKVVDPSLIIYPVYGRHKDTHVLTNGDQTSTICAGLEAGITASAALLSRDCEPDAPNFTPRISLLAGPDGYELNIIKAASPAGTASVHFDYTFPYLPGVGHCIHTYIDDGDPLPSFSGEPVAFAYTENMGEKIWKAINPEFKISLLECVLDLETFKMRSVRIFNKHTGD